MAEKNLKSITFPGLPDKYVVPQVDNTLAVAGRPADAKKVGDELSDLKGAIEQLDGTLITDTASGAIVTIPDGADDVPVKSLVVGIEPVQDLHGYDYPWPAGGGMNLLNESEIEQNKYIDIDSGTAQSADSTDATGFIEIKPNTTYYFGETGLSSGQKIEWAAYYDANKDYVSGVILNVNGAFTTPADVAYLRVSLQQNRSNAYVNYPATVTTYSPYSNICPISGWMGANVTRTGFNVWDEEWETGDLYDSTGLPHDSATRIRSKNHIPAIPSATYHFCVPQNVVCYICVYDKNKSWIAGNISVRPANNYQFMNLSNGYYIKFYTDGTAYGGTYHHDICINLSDPAKNGTYEPGHAVTIPITFPSEAGTVYGGTLDVTTGVLTVDRASVDLGTLDWTYDGSYHRFISQQISDVKDASARTLQAICSIYPCISDGRTIANVPDHSFYLASNSIVIHESNYSDAGSFKAAIAGRVCVYPIVPLSHNLAPVTVNTLLGQNNVWADTGDTALEYVANTKLYIEKLTQPTEDDMVANANIASGTYFMIGNNLYLSTTTIPAGDTINPGTNCTQTNLAAALNAINA